jgi:hypothetical protein
VFSDMTEYTVTQRIIRRMTLKAESKEQATALAAMAVDSAWRTVRHDYVANEPGGRAEHPKNPILDEGPWCRLSDD